MNKSVSINFIIYLFISLVSFFHDQFTTDCKHISLYTYINSFIHHLFSNYLWFGSIIFGNYKTHLVVILLVLFGWRYNGGCVLTHMYNKACGIKKTMNHKDIAYNFIMKTNISYYQLLGILILFDTYFSLYKK